MSLRQRKGFKALAILLAFSFAQVCVQTSFAGPGGNRVTIPVPQQFIARLTTTGNKPITVNGASTAGGATILTGATLETPDQVSATIDLGALGTVELKPNSSIQIDFDDNGNVRVKVLRGCVVMKKKGKGDGEIYTAEGAWEKTNSSRKGMAFCYAAGQLNGTGSGAAAAAAGGAAAGGLFGLGTAATVAIIGGIAGGTVAIVAGTHGHNPSN